MTRDELIEKLQRCPADAEIFTSDGESGHWDDPSVYLVDAWRGQPYPGASERVDTELFRGRGHEPNCKAVVISRFGEGRRTQTSCCVSTGLRALERQNPDRR